MGRIRDIRNALGNQAAAARLSNRDILTQHLEQANDRAFQRLVVHAIDHISQPLAQGCLTRGDQRERFFGSRGPRRDP